MSKTKLYILTAAGLALSALAAMVTALTIPSRLTMDPTLTRVADIRFAVQPIMGTEATRKAYQPLADYIAAATGKSVELITTYNYTEYWSRMKAGKEFNLILDAPFYIDYRIKNQGHVPLVKVPGVISNSLVTRADAGILDISELIGKKVATITPPSPGSLILQKLFTKAARQPYLVSAKSSEHALEMVLNGTVVAAIVPTPLVGQAMSQGNELFTLETTPPIPHIALTAGPDIDVATRETITKALLDANKTAKGLEILKAIGFEEGFETAAPEIYAGYSEYLNQQW
jgi:ABC-type phosphate/phosphonate transport system substrate-binding protein